MDKLFPVEQFTHSGFIETDMSRILCFKAFCFQEQSAFIIRMLNVIQRERKK